MTSRMNFTRRFAMAAALLALGAIGDAGAADYPTRPVRWIVPYPAGGATDIVARIIGQALSERLGQTFVIENKPGAGNNIGTEAVVHAAPDGYTVLLVNPANAINATLYPKLSSTSSATCAGRRLHAGAQRHGGEPGGPGQHGRRVHRLRQGQSGQGQLGDLGQRHVGSSFRRAV